MKIIKIEIEDNVYTKFLQTAFFKNEIPTKILEEFIADYIKMNNTQYNNTKYKRG